MNVMTLSKMRRLYLREAIRTLILAMVILRLVPQRRIFAWVSRSPRQVYRFAVDEVAWVSWAIETVVATSRIKPGCLPRALAACVMLRRRGIPNRLRLGVAREGESLTAHAWIEVGKENVVGETEADRFVPIADFGSSL
jgi:hypothetical protein